jgi:hypothetical protein
VKELELIKLPRGEKKKRIVEFVISKGVASHSEIIKFVVDQNYGEGTYDSGNQLEKEYDFSIRRYVDRMKNRWRGYYSAGFSARYRAPWLLDETKQHFLKKITNPEDPNFGKYIGFSMTDEEFKSLNRIKKSLDFM